MRDGGAEPRSEEIPERHAELPAGFGETQEGVGLFQFTIKDGERWGTGKAYLRPALRRRNLTVVTGALASRIALEGGRAVGVEYSRHGGSAEIARAEREVILSGGVINSPQLLQLSGVGNARELERPFERRGAVVDAGKDVRVEVDHGVSLPPTVPSTLGAWRCAP